MPLAPDVYDRLKTTQIDGLTITQLNSASGLTFIEPGNIKFLGQAITLNRALEASRTYAGGKLPIPELSDVENLSISDGATGTLTPSTTEVFLIQNISSNQDVICSLIDSDGHVSMLKTVTSSAPFMPTSSLYITKNLFLSFANASGSTATVNVAYHKMSL